MRTCLALVAVLLTGCASTPVAQSSGPSATGPGAAPASVSASASAAPDPGARADAIVASVSVPPGSVRVDKAPTAAIGSGFTLGAPEAFRVSRTVFWTTSDSAADTLAFITAHPPQGMGVGNCCSGIGDATASARMIDYSGHLRPGEALVDLQVVVGAIPGGGTGIRVGVEIDLVQPHGADQVLAGVQSVVLTGHAATGHALTPVTLQGAPAARLGADVNALATVLGRGGCLPPGADITMVFATSEGKQSAELDGPCDVIWMGATVDDPGLYPSAALEADLGTALGLAASSLAR